jgi:hypothetical protein
MSTNDHPAATVASLLVTIHQDESGALSTSVEALPAPGMAQPSLPLYGSEPLIETRSFATRTPKNARSPRWRRRLLAAAAVGALVGAVVALHPSSRPSDPLPSSERAVPTAATTAFTLSATGCPAAGGSACSDPSTILPGLDTACIDLLTTAARALDEDPQQWAQSLLVRMVRTGKPLADVIHQWLTATRADVLSTRYADVNLESILRGIDSAIALADTGACSPRP